MRCDFNLLNVHEGTGSGLVPWTPCLDSLSQQQRIDASLGPGPLRHLLRIAVLGHSLKERQLLRDCPLPTELPEIRTLEP